MADIPVNASDALITVVVTTNGQTAFDFDFLTYDPDTMFADHVSLTGVRTPLVEGVTFTVTGVGQPTGGTITLMGGAPVTVIGEQIIIYRSTIIERIADYQRAGDFRAATVNLEMDTVFMIMQELERDIARALSAPIGSTVTLPLPLEDTVLGWVGGQLVNIDPATFINMAGVATAAQGALAESAVQRAGDRMLGNLAISSVEAAFGLLTFEKSSVGRWGLGITSDAAAGFFIHAYNNDGSFKEAVIGIDRTSGIIFHKGSALRNEAWFWNDIRQYGGDPTGAANNGAAMTSAKLDPRGSTHFPDGTFKFSAGYDFATQALFLDRGTSLVDTVGADLWGVLGGVGTGHWTPTVKQKERSIVRAGGFAFKADGYADDAVADHRVLESLYWYDRPAPIPGVGAVIHRMYAQIGSQNQNTQGSFIGAEINLQLWQVSATGRAGVANEFNPISAGVGFSEDVALTGPQAGAALYFDGVVSGPWKVRPVFLAGWTNAVRNLFNTGDWSSLQNAADAPDGLGHYGTFGLTAVTNPQIGGFGYAQKTTFPLLAMGLFSGFSGPSSALDGIAGTATFGAYYGIMIGRHGGQWTNGVATRSKFKWGIGVEDWLDGGVMITNRHPSGSGPGLVNDYASLMRDIITITSTGTTDSRIAFNITSASVNYASWVGQASFAPTQFQIFAPNSDAGSSEFAAAYINRTWKFATTGVDRLFIDRNGLTTIGAAASTVSRLNVDTLNANAASMNIRLNETSHVTSRQSGIDFAGLFYAVTDYDQNGQLNFGIYNNSAAVWPFKIAPNNWLLIRNINISNLATSASGLAAGDVWRDNAAGNVLKIV